MEKFIYADNSATTRVSDSVLAAMKPYIQDYFGNPSSIYKLGRDMQKKIEESRAQIAEAFGAQKNEIFFTSGGSESDNWAIKGAAKTMAKRGKKHIITTNFEHHAVLHTCAALEKGMLLLYQYSPHTSQRMEKQKYCGVEQSSRCPDNRFVMPRASFTFPAPVITGAEGGAYGLPDTFSRFL